MFKHGHSCACIYSIQLVTCLSRPGGFWNGLKLFPPSSRSSVHFRRQENCNPIDRRDKYSHGVTITVVFGFSQKKKKPQKAASEQCYEVRPEKVCLNLRLTQKTESRVGDFLLFFFFIQGVAESSQKSVRLRVEFYTSRWIQRLQRDCKCSCKVLIYINAGNLLKQKTSLPHGGLLISVRRPSEWFRFPDVLTCSKFPNDHVCLACLSSYLSSFHEILQACCRLGPPTPLGRRNQWCEQSSEGSSIHPF